MQITVKDVECRGRRALLSVAVPHRRPPAVGHSAAHGLSVHSEASEAGGCTDTPLRPLLSTRSARIIGAYAAAMLPAAPHKVQRMRAPLPLGGKLQWASPHGAPGRHPRAQALLQMGASRFLALLGANRARHVGRTTTVCRLERETSIHTDAVAALRVPADPGSKCFSSFLKTPGTAARPMLARPLAPCSGSPCRPTQRNWAANANATTARPWMSAGINEKQTEQNTRKARNQRKGRSVALARPPACCTWQSCTRSPRG